jgi:hypothetical protein
MTADINTNRQLERRTFAEAFAPIRADFEASGMTAEELDELLESEIKEYRAEKRREQIVPVNWIGATE